MNHLSKQFKRDTKAFSLTLILYLPLLFWWSQSKVELFPERVSTPLVLDLQKFVCKEESTPEPLLKEPIIEDDFFEDFEEIMQEPVVSPKPLTTKPKPIVKQKKPIIKKPIKKKKLKKISKKRVVKKKHNRTSKGRQKQTKRKNSTASVSKAKTNQFITRLKKAINTNKIYPKMAKKRGLQGTVHVSFTINSSGKVSNITVKGSKMFIKATKRAILRSFPINTKNISLPLKVNLRLNYTLKRS